MLVGKAMARLFISHSSVDNASAVAIRDWLATEGWDDVFLDLDPHRGISAGERWERALNEAALRCEAVLFLVSRAWLASRWCLKEFNLAHKLNKRLFGVLIEALPVGELPQDLTETWQIVDLASGQDHTMFRVLVPLTHKEAYVTFSKEGLVRLRNGLAKAGLDPRFFAWPPEHDRNRAPYRGLKPLDTEDAGIFFGRDAPIIEALDALRGLADAAPPRLFVIIGASGAGKSSFLRAGLLPRLARDDRKFLPLPVIRPERGVISGETGLLRALETTFAATGLPQTRVRLREAINGGAKEMRPLLRQLVEKAFAAMLAHESSASKPVIVMAIDQAEELFVGEAGAESQVFLELMRDLAREDQPGILIVFTIRSDSYDRLETAKAFEGMRQQALPLLPMPRGAYQTVIEGPVARLRVANRAFEIEPRLTQRLLEEIEKGGGSDALPLLAFTLEQLYLDYGAGGALRLSDYEAFGGIRGAIEAAVQRALAAADSDSRIPADREARLTLLRRGLIPWLAGIDPDTGSPRRRIARLADIPAEAAPLVRLLVEQRLLTIDRITVRDGDQETTEITIEPAHEALLRQWGLLKDWLAEDFAALTTLEGIKRATRDWAANAKETAWLTYSGGRLEDAERLRVRKDLARYLAPIEQEYLASCRAAETSRIEGERAQIARTRRFQRRAGWALTAVAALTLAVLAGVLWQQRQTAKSETAVFVQLSLLALDSAQFERAARYAVAAMPPRNRFDDPLYPRSREPGVLLARIDGQRRLGAVLRGHSAGVAAGAFDASGRLFATASADGTARIFDVKDASKRFLLQGHTRSIQDVAFSAEAKSLATASQDRTVRIWDLDTGQSKHVLRGGATDAKCATFYWGCGYARVKFSPDGRYVVTGSFHGEIIVWNTADGTRVYELIGHQDRINALEFDPMDANRLLSVSDDGTAHIWDVSSGRSVAELKGHRDFIRAAAFSPDGKLVATAGSEGLARAWNSETGAELAVLRGHERYISAIVFSPDSKRLVTASWDSTARIWDVGSWQPITVLRGHGDLISDARFAPNGNFVATASWDNSARIWDAITGALIAELKGHEGNLSQAIFSPDGRYLATTSADGTARLWNTKAQSEIFTFQGHDGEVERAAFSPDSKLVVTAARDGTARVWSAVTGELKMALRGHRDRIMAIDFSPDGSRILTASDDKTALLWSTVGMRLKEFTHDDKVRDVRFSADGRLVVTASFDKTARIWDAGTGALVWALKGHEHWLRSATFSPDGTRVATTSRDRTARVWDVSSGKEIVVLRGHDGEVWKSNFSPDGRRIVTAALDGTARIWDSTTGAQIVELAHSNRVWDAAYNADGRLVVTASADGRGRVWTESGENKFMLVGHKDQVMTAVFSPDGRLILTSSHDRTARLWDATDGAELTVLAGHQNVVQDAVFNSAGQQILTVSDDKTARTWLVLEAFLGDDQMRRDHACEYLRRTGTHQFTDREMEDPILSGRADLRSPCERFGWLHPEYYGRMMTRLWTWIEGGWQSSASNPKLN